MKAARITYHRAASVAQAVELAGRFDGMAKLMAGGQSLLPMMNLRMLFADQVIDISSIAALREARAEGGRQVIGAGVTHAMLEDGKVEDPARGYLRHVAGGIAYRSVRNRGTVGGSLAHADPAADWPTALRALDAVALIEGPQGSREVPLAEFQVGLMETALSGAEILKGVAVPRLSERARWAYLKFCRKVGECPHSIGAVVLDPALGIANVVLGAIQPKPVRLPRLSAGLASLQIDSLETLVHEDLAASTDLDPESYEFQLHATILRRAVRKAVGK
jgi:carbon-monoxide dehydrogenase medium subunit